MLKIKNIIIFVVIAAILVLVYVFFIKKSPEQANLVSSSVTTPKNIVNTSDDITISIENTDKTNIVAKDFLSLLLNVRNIKLDDAIFADPAFNTLRDSSIVLTQDGTEGRPNPFAQFGNDAVVAPPTNTNITSDTLPETPMPPSPPECKLPQVLDTATNTCVTPTTPKTSSKDIPATYYDAPLKITEIVPISAKLGAKITVTGTGFTKTNNSFYFYSPDTNESASVKGLSSADGSKLTVTIPTQLTEQTYTTYVINTKGASNSIDFTVTP